MTPKVVKESESRGAAEFWMGIGTDIGEIKATVNALSSEFHKFTSNEFHEICRKQEELENQLNSTIKTTGIIIGITMILWTIANVCLHAFKIL